MFNTYIYVKYLYLSLNIKMTVKTIVNNFHIIKRKDIEKWKTQK